MTGLLNISAEDAEEYSESLAQIGEGWWRQIALAFRMGMPEALGLSHDEWKTKYFGHIRVSREQLPSAAKELQDEGLDQRESADVLGVNQSTVSRALRDDDANASGDSPVGEEPQVDEPEQLPIDANASEYDDECDRCGSEYNGGGHCPSCGGWLDLPEPESDTSDASDTDLSPPSPVSPPVNDGDEWYTPPWLFRALGIEFSLDVCAPLDQTYSAVPADKHLTIEDDGLAQHWHGTVWCNPPYSKPEPWARRLIHHGDGLLLTHIPMNAGWAVDVWESCDAIRLFQAMEFVRPDGTSQRPGYWLQLAAFGPVATEALGRIQPLGDAAFNKRRVASPMWKQVAE